jgi:hypothetical protein
MWAARIDTKASALIRAFGADAYSKARQRERQADNNATAQRWRAVSRWLWRARPASASTSTTSTQMASDNRCGDGTAVQLLSTEPDQLGELKRIISDK